MFNKQLIVNGSLNTTITLQEILDNFTPTDYCRAAWNITVNLNVYHKLANLPTYDQVSSDPKEWLIRQWDLLKRVEADKLKEEQAASFAEGEALFSALESIRSRSPHKHCIELSAHQALGFLKNQRSWNGYDPRAVAEAISSVEALNLYLDYGVNNPNTGANIVNWAQQDDYWFLRIKRGNNNPSKITEDAHEKILTILERTKPDSLRHEDNDFFRTYVMWWD